MTLHSTMSANGTAESMRVTTGRRKRIAVRIEYNDRTGPGASAHLIGSCGHTLRWLAAVNVADDGPITPRYLTDYVGRRMTCQHNDCRIPGKETG